MFRSIKISLVVLSLFFLVACGSSVEEVAIAVNQTVESRPPEIVQETVEVPVTVEVEREVEVTRLVEVEVEVEVTSIVEVEMEVTRLVEVEVTPIPTATPLPSPTSPPLPTAVPNTGSAPAAPPPSASIESQFISEIEEVKRQMNNYVRMIDGALATGRLNCQEAVDIYDRVQFSAQFDVSNQRTEVQGAYGVYRNAVDVFVNGTRDMDGNCRSFLADPSSAGGIPQQQWGLARVEASKAVDIIVPAIRQVGGDVG